jgi:hypothetical protein
MIDSTDTPTGVAASHVATIAVAVLAVALAVGSQSFVVTGVALTGFLVLAGLRILSGQTVRRLTAGNAAVALGVLYASIGVVTVAADPDPNWIWLAAFGTWIAVVCGGAAGRVAADWTEQWRSIATLGLGGLGLILAGVVFSVTPAGVAVLVDFFMILLALTGQPVSLSVFLVLLAFVFGAIGLTLKLLPNVTLVGLDARPEDVEAVESATLGALFFLLVSFFGALFMAFMPTETTRIESIQFVTTFTPLRVLFAAILLGGPLVGLCGLVLRWAWHADEERLRDRGVVVFASVAVTVGGVLAALVGVPGRGQPIGIAAAGDRALAFGGLAIVVTLLAVLVRLVYGGLLVGRDRTDWIVLGGFTAAIAVSVGTDAILTPLVAVGATLVAWDVTTHGRGLVESLGDDAPTTDAEFVHASGSTVVAVLGVGVATIATYSLQRIGPELVSWASVPGLAIGALLIVVGATFATMDERSSS